jgi:hypothetical protein
MEGNGSIKMMFGMVGDIPNQESQGCKGKRSAGISEHIVGIGAIGMLG